MRIDGCEHPSLVPIGGVLLKCAYCGELILNREPMSPATVAERAAKNRERLRKREAKRKGIIARRKGLTRRKSGLR